MRICFAWLNNNNKEKLKWQLQLMILVLHAVLANQFVQKYFQLAVVNAAAVADNIDSVKEAADACPVGAIEVE